MRLIPGWTWLGRRRARLAQRRRADDLGDMGTTFALDAAMASLNPASRADLQGRDAAIDPEQPWEHRPTRPASL